jgi:hypothetical protein
MLENKTTARTRSVLQACPTLDLRLFAVKNRIGKGKAFLLDAIEG